MQPHRDAALQLTTEDSLSTAPWHLTLTRSADKAQKKLDRALRIRLKQSLIQIAQAPEQVGERLSMPLTGIYAHHVKYMGKEYRVAYAMDSDTHTVVILLVGPHENFYKRLKLIADWLLR